MSGKVYFGNAIKQTWIPAPATGLDASTDAFYTSTQLLNGRASAKRSQASHRSFNPNWRGSLNAAEISDSLHTIKDFSDGIYGTGPFYWLDPFAIDQNLLAPNWASPMLTQIGWNSISSIGTASTVTTTTNTNNYPYQSLRLTFTAAIAESTKTFRIIIPQDYKLHFGWHGEQNSGSATFILRGHSRTTGTTTDVTTTPIATTSTVRTNATMRGDLYDYVDILVQNPSASTSQIDISGLIAQVLPENDSVVAGGFITGRGTTALEFSNSLKISYLSAPINNGQVEVSTTFTEV